MKRTLCRALFGMDGALLLCMGLFLELVFDANRSRSL